jgi:hypothetical protein
MNIIVLNIKTVSGTDSRLHNAIGFFVLDQQIGSIDQVSGFIL